MSIRLLLRNGAESSSFPSLLPNSLIHGIKQVFFQNVFQKICLLRIEGNLLDFRRPITYTTCNVLWSLVPDLQPILLRQNSSLPSNLGSVHLGITQDSPQLIAVLQLLAYFL